jgi:hypothetical protein
MKKRVDLSLPEFGFIVATRAALGAGVALLATGAISRTARRRLGGALLGIGAATTVPAAMLLFGHHGGRAEGARAGASPAPKSDAI